MSTNLWMSIEPQLLETRLSLSVPLVGPVLRARLPTEPMHPRALAMLLEALSCWYGRPLCAALDAGAEDVVKSPERWSRLLGELDGERVFMEWVHLGEARRDRFLGRLGSFERAGRLTSFASGGRR